MIALDQLPIWVHSGQLQVVIETPKGSRYKYEHDPKTGQFRLDKVLPMGLVFPFNFGFIPRTKGEDGDPLDVLVLLEDPVFPGCVLTTQLLGVIEAEQTENEKTIRNDRFLAVLDTKRNPAKIHSIDELDPSVLDEVEAFFIAYNKSEGRKFKPIGRKDAKKAKHSIENGTIEAKQ